MYFFLFYKDYHHYETIIMSNLDPQCLLLTLYISLWNNLLYSNNTNYKFLFQHWSWATVGENLTVRLRKVVFSRILQQEIGWFDLQENKVGVLTSRLAVDATIVRGVRRYHDESSFLLSYH